MPKWRQPSLATQLLAQDLSEEYIARLAKGDDILPPHPDGTPRIVSKSLIRLCATLCALQTVRELTVEDLLLMVNDDEAEFEKLLAEAEESGKRGA